MSEDRVILTRQGYEKLKAELDHLMTKKRREIAEDIARARAFGDLKENAEYDAAKNSQAMNEAKINELNNKLSRAELLDDSRIPKDQALLGAQVTLEDLETGENIRYILVSSAEANIKEDKISIDSPVGKAMLGHRVGDEIKIQVPAGALKYKVKKIER
jgi:transcription elongation factor GreA